MVAPVSSRRALFLGLAVLPVIGSKAIAAGPSDLARACVWCVEDRLLIDQQKHPGVGDDDASLDAALDRHNAVFSRAIVTPSADRSEVAAKARLALDDFERFVEVHGWERLDDGQRLMKVVLQEVIALCA